jgi:hypothetical protein
MKNIEIKEIVAKLLQEGSALSEIQKILQSEYDFSMTFLDLRLLASELEGIDWTKGDAKEETAEEKKKKQEEADAKMEGKTIVDVSKIQRPGIALSGSVKFASGASADWILDQSGQLGFEKSDGEPTPEDIQEFQSELQKSLGR